jgi:hypothetical protein
VEVYIFVHRIQEEFGRKNVRLAGASYVPGTDGSWRSVLVDGALGAGARHVTGT